MTDDERDETSGEAEIDEEGRNPTQRRMDEEGVEPAPVDASWTGDDDAPDSALSTHVEGSDPSTSGESPAAAAAQDNAPGPAASTLVEGPDPSASVKSPAAPGSQANEPIFEPDVPLAAEVNREAGAGKSRKGVIAAAAGGFAVLGAVLLRRRR